MVWYYLRPGSVPANRAPSSRRTPVRCARTAGQGTESVLARARPARHHGHMTHYGDYCPIAVGVEVLGDRWTPLVIRELMVGAGGFNEIHRGIPRISRTLLAQRLRLLERRGLVRREPGPPGRPGRYTLTPAGESVTPIVWAMGHWAAEWIFGDPAEEDCALWTCRISTADPSRSTTVSPLAADDGR
jgi:DNA-binding HxlR family transcriptional regulator